MIRRHSKQTNEQSLSTNGWPMARLASYDNECWQCKQIWQHVGQMSESMSGLCQQSPQIRWFCFSLFLSVNRKLLWACRFDSSRTLGIAKHCWMPSRNMDCNRRSWTSLTGCCAMCHLLRLHYRMCFVLIPTHPVIGLMMAEWTILFLCISVNMRYGSR